MRFVSLLAVSLFACGGAKSSPPQNATNASGAPSSDALVALVRASTAPVAGCVDGTSTPLGTAFDAGAAAIKKDEGSSPGPYVEYGECHPAGRAPDGWKGKQAPGATWDCSVAATFDMSKVPASEEVGEDTSRVEAAFSLDNQGALIPASLGCI